MNWQKLGFVHVANGTQEWAVSHAYVPTPYLISDDRIRVFVSFLDRHQVGRIGYVDVASDDPCHVLNVSERPALDIGEPGTFDDNGVTPVSIVEHQGKLRLYYIGWQLGVKVPYFVFAGLAVSDDRGENFQRYQRTPILDRSDRELFVRSAPSVLIDDGKWRMWYIAGDRWINSNGKQIPTYNIRYLESPDGVRWPAEGRVCLDLDANADEFGFGRPYVLRDGALLRMWYSVRSVSRTYRIGYAESTDGLTWTRKDGESGIDVSAEGSDSEMICCSAVQTMAHSTYLFYNGNNYGERGFGVARLQD